MCLIRLKVLCRFSNMYLFIEIWSYTNRVNELRIFWRHSTFKIISQPVITYSGDIFKGANDHQDLYRGFHISISHCCRCMLQSVSNVMLLINDQINRNFVQKGSHFDQNRRISFQYSSLVRQVWLCIITLLMFNDVENKLVICHNLVSMTDLHVYV